MADDGNDIGKKLRDDINKVFDEAFKERPAYNSHEKLVVLVLDALMNFHQENAYMFRTDVEGMARMTREARDKARIEEKATEYGAKDKTSEAKAPDIEEINDELQVLEYIELNKRPLTEWERDRQSELSTDKTALMDMATKLQERQRKERAVLERNQQAEIHNLGQSKELHLRHVQERTDQTLRFEKERQRYVREYYGAKQITKEMHEQERKESLEPEQRPKLLH
jgi:hypothetical protein